MFRQKSHTAECLRCMINPPVINVTFSGHFLHASAKGWCIIDNLEKNKTGC